MICLNAILKKKYFEVSFFCLFLSFGNGTGIVPDKYGKI